MSYYKLIKQYQQRLENMKDAVSTGKEILPVAKIRMEDLLDELTNLNINIQDEMLKRFATEQIGILKKQTKQFLEDIEDMIELRNL